MSLSYKNGSSAKKASWSYWNSSRRERDLNPLATKKYTMIHIIYRYRNKNQNFRIISLVPGLAEAEFVKPSEAMRKIAKTAKKYDKELNLRSRISNFLEVCTG